MCGRYANHVSEMRSWARILQDWPTDVALSWNIAPSQTVPAFTGPQGVGMRWGLVPHWSKESTPKYATFNARVESVADKPAFRNAWGKSKRCLIPAQGYYEWRKEEKAKQPYFIRSVDGEPMVFGGIWESRSYD
jgi:putative SOS response-associated peptidase YedK